MVFLFFSKFFIHFYTTVISIIVNKDKAFQQMVNTRYNFSNAMVFQCNDSIFLWFHYVKFNMKIAMVMLSDWLNLSWKNILLNTFNEIFFFVKGNPNNQGILTESYKYCFIIAVSNTKIIENLQFIEQNIIYFCPSLCLLQLVLLSPFSTADVFQFLNTILCKILNITSDHLCNCIKNHAAFLIHVDMWQLLKSMLVHNEKKHYHVGKKVADIGFTWHPDTLLQPSDISVGISLL